MVWADLKQHGLLDNIVVGCVARNEPVVYHSSPHCTSFPPVVATRWFRQQSRYIPCCVSTINAHHVEGNGARSAFYRSCASQRVYVSKHSSNFPYAGFVATSHTTGGIRCEGMGGYIQNELRSTVIARATLLRARKAAGAPERSVVILILRYCD